MPVWPVSPVEKACRLLRYDSNELLDNIYAATLPDTSNISDPDRWIKIPATPDLHRIFEEGILEWLEEKDRWLDTNIAAFEEGIRRAGLDWSLASALIEYDRINRTKKFDTEFYDVVISNIDSFPPPLLLRVEGIDAILEKL